MKTIGELRRENLALLILQEGTAAKLAARTGIAAAYLSQIKNASPDSKTGVPKNMGDPVARKIELKTGKPSGWMDTDHTQPLTVHDIPGDLDDMGELAAPTRTVQVIGEVMGGDNGYLEQDALVAEEVFLLTYSRDPQAYGLKLRGDSMRPRFKPGEYLLIEPSLDVQPGDDVVICLHDGRKMLKELVISRDDEIEVTSVNNGDRFTVYRSDIQSIHRVGGHFLRYSSFVVKR